MVIKAHRKVMATMVMMMIIVTMPMMMMMMTYMIKMLYIIGLR